MRIAALDLGSNTFLCLIADVESATTGLDTESRIVKVVSDEIRMVRLGQGVSGLRRFHPEALQRADAALADFKKSIDLHRPERILAMATSAARDVQNADELFALGHKYDIPIEIIPGAKEAEITYSGSVSGLPASALRTLVIDIGGGSTEFICGQNRNIQWGQSLDLGCVRLKEKLGLIGPLTSALEGQARDLITAELASLPRHTALNELEADPDIFRVDQILAVAGTPTELARMEVGAYDPLRIDGFVFSCEKIEKWIQRLAPLTASEITAQFQVPSGRADVLTLGLLILSESMRYFRCEQIQVSTRGVRFGVALVAFGRGKT